MSEKQEHQCTRQHLVTIKPILKEDEDISLVYKCRICGRAYEKEYRPLRDNGWLYDPIKKDLVSLPFG